MSKTIHVMLSGKGGVGKSTCCAMLGQALLGAGRTVEGIDVDPLTPTFVAFKGLNVRWLEGTIDRFGTGDIDGSLYDGIVEIIEAGTATDYIIDVGASNDVVFMSYLERSDTFEMLTTEYGFNVFIHTIIKGGEDQKVTTDTVDTLQTRFPTVPKFIWLNEFQQSCHFGAEVGAKGFGDTATFKALKGVIRGVFALPKLNPTLEMPLIARANKLGLLLSEIEQSKMFVSPEKMRLKKYKRTVIDAISQHLKSVLENTETVSEA